MCRGQKLVLTLNTLREFIEHLFVDDILVEFMYFSSSSIIKILNLFVKINLDNAIYNCHACGDRSLIWEVFRSYWICEYVTIFMERLIYKKL